MPTKKRILVTILNWGLGHVTRCIPIIRELLQQNTEVILASDGRALNLLKEEFPQLICLELPAYNITYRTNNMFWNIGTQLPKIAKAIFQEHQLIEKIVEKHRINAIISDNRYGCYSRKVQSIFLTHQINIKIPNHLIEQQIAYINKRCIQRFSACWIPDFEDEPNLAGSLSHGFSLKNVEYIGALSRMQYHERPKKYDVIAVLSGPEPQRTYLEQLLLEQMQDLSQQFLLVRGVTETYLEEQLTKNIKVISYLASERLNEAILESEVIISRSGYSTLMDLAYLQKRAILIATPGQTEQEYLAQHFQDQGIFYSQSQSNLNLKMALKEVESYKGFGAEDFPKGRLGEVILQFLNSL